MTADASAASSIGTGIGAARASAGALPVLTTALRQALWSFPLDLLDVVISYASDEWAALRATVVVMGHVDGGKSTLLGRVLHEHHPAGDAITAKYLKEATTRGKASFRYAWWLDHTQAERLRGISIFWRSQRVFTRAGVDLTFIDTPGHVDFTYNALSPVIHADIALIVIPAIPEAVDLYVSAMAYQCVVAMSQGVRQIVVAVTHCDHQPLPYRAPSAKGHPPPSAAEQRAGMVAFMAGASKVLSKVAPGLRACTFLRDTTDADAQLYDYTPVHAAAAAQTARARATAQPGAAQALVGATVAAVSTQRGGTADAAAAASAVASDFAELVSAQMRFDTELVFVPCSGLFGWNVCDSPRERQLSAQVAATIAAADAKTKPPNTAAASAAAATGTTADDDTAAPVPPATARRIAEAVSAAGDYGDVTTRVTLHDWYDGPTLLEVLGGDRTRRAACPTPVPLPLNVIDLQPTVPGPPAQRRAAALMTFDRIMSLTADVAGCPYPLRACVAANYKWALSPHSRRRLLPADEPTVRSPFGLIAVASIVSGTLRVGDAITVTPSPLVPIGALRAKAVRMRVSRADRAADPTAAHFDAPPEQRTCFARVNSIERYRVRVDSAAAGDLIGFAYDLFELVLPATHATTGATTAAGGSLARKAGGWVNPTLLTVRKVKPTRLAHGAVLGPCAVAARAAVQRASAHASAAQKQDAEHAVAAMAQAGTPPPPLTALPAKLTAVDPALLPFLRVALSPAAPYPVASFTIDLQCVWVPANGYCSDAFRERRKPLQLRAGFAPQCHAHGQSFKVRFAEILSVTKHPKNAAKLAAALAAHATATAQALGEGKTEPAAPLAASMASVIEEYDTARVRVVPERLVNVERFVSGAGGVWHRLSRLVLRDQRYVVGFGRVSGLETAREWLDALQHGVPYLREHFPRALLDICVAYLWRGIVGG